MTDLFCTKGSSPPESGRPARPAIEHPFIGDVVRGAMADGLQLR